MILKRQEKDGIVKALYESSNILASIYDNNNSDLTLIFKSGTKYKYPKVSKSDYMRFEIAESQGNVFNSHIKKYTFEKLENVDTAKIIAEANTLKATEDEKLIKDKRENIRRSIFNLSSIIAINENFENAVLIEYMDKLIKEYEDLKPLIKL